MCHTFGECVKTVGANNYLPLQLDSRLHGNDKKLSLRSNLKKIYNTNGKYVKTVGANNYLPLQLDSRFHGNARKLVIAKQSNQNLQHLRRICDERKGK
jgi:hypothetical protein